MDVYINKSGMNVLFYLLDILFLLYLVNQI